MIIFLLSAIGFVFVALAVYVAASIRLERSRGAKNKPPNLIAEDDDE